MFKKITRSISCSVNNYIPRKDIPQVRAPSSKNRRPRSPARNRAPMKDISHRHCDRSQNRGRAQNSSRVSRWERAAANKASKPLEPLRPLEVSIPVSILTYNSYMDPDRLHLREFINLGPVPCVGIPPPTTPGYLYTCRPISIYFCHCGFGSSLKSLVIKHIKGKSMRDSP